MDFNRLEFEKKEFFKDLNVFLTQGDSIGHAEQLEKYLTNFNEGNLCHKNIKLDVVRRLKRKQDIVDALLSEDLVQVKRSLCNSWFFREVTPEYMIEHVIPKCPVSVREKVVKALAKNITNPEDADMYFKFIILKYQRYLAEYFLPYCTEELIVSHLSEFPLETLSSELFLTFIDVLESKPSTSILHNFINQAYESKINLYTSLTTKYGYLDSGMYLFDNHRNVFIEMFTGVNSCFANVKFGKRRSRNLILNNKHQVLSSPSRFVIDYNFKLKVLVRHMTQDEVLLSMVNYLKMNLTKYDNEQCRSWLTSNLNYFDKLQKIIKSETLFQLLTSTYKQVFNVDPLKCDNFWIESVLKVAPLDLRESRLTERKKQKDHTYSRLRYMYRTSIALPLIKEDLSKEKDVALRFEFLQLMVKSCWFNKDMAALEEVLKLVLSKYKNDNAAQLNYFFENIVCSPHARLLTSVHWELLEDLAKIIRLRFTEPLKLLNFFLKYHLGKSSYEETVRLHLDTLMSMYTANKLHLPDLGMNHHDLVNTVIKEIRRLDAPLHANLKTILCIIQRWNKVHSKELIKTEEWLVDMIHTYISDTESGYEKYPFAYLIPDDVRHTFFPKLATVSKEECVLYYLVKNVPGMIKENVEIITKYHPASICDVKLLDTLNIKQEVINWLLSRFDSSPITDKVVIIDQLSYLIDTETYLSTCQQYFPTSDVIDLNQSFDYNALSTKIALCVRNLKHSPLKYKLISLYLKGDYTKLILPTLYNMARNTDVYNFKQFTYNNIDIAVSVRKNIIRTLLEVVDNDERSQLLVELWNNDKHVSIRELLYDTARRCFYSQKTEREWNVMYKFVLESEINNRTVLYLNNIPFKFIHSYFELLVDSSMLSGALSSTTYDMFDYLPAPFIVSIIKNNVSKESMKYVIYLFTSKYIIYLFKHTAPDTAFLEQIIFNLEDKKQSHQFFSCLANELLSQTTMSQSLVEYIIDLWGKLFHYSDDIDEFIKYKLLLIYSKLVNVDTLSVEFGEGVRQLLVSLDHPVEFVPIVFACVKSLCTKKGGTVFKYTQILDGLLKDTSHLCSNLLSIHIIELLPHYQTADELIRQEYINKLRDIDDIIVMTYLNRINSLSKCY